MNFRALFLIVFALQISPPAFASGACRATVDLSGLPYKAPLKGPQAKVKIVVEGAGDIVRWAYGPELRNLRAKYPEREISMTFLDRSEFWRENPAAAQKMQTIKEIIKDAGGTYLDKSGLSPEALEAALRGLDADVVIIATPDSTHVDMAEPWIKRGAQVFVEKPLDANITKAERLLEILKNRPGQVWAFDHFRAAFLPTPEQAARIERHLGKTKLFKFYLVEDHSSADKWYKASENRDGAIESEGRVKALGNGLILDLFAHGPPLVKNRGDITTIQLKSLKAGKYTGVDGDPSREASIPAETFAEIKFTFKDFKGRTVDAEALVGKGVGGARSYGRDFEHEMLGVEEIGENGNRLFVTILPGRETGRMARAEFLDRDGRQVGPSIELTSPYYNFLESILQGNYAQTMTPDEGAHLLKLMNEIRRPIQERLARGEKLPTYPGGMAGVRPSLPVEEIQSRLPVLHEWK